MFRDVHVSLQRFTLVNHSTRESSRSQFGQRRTSRNVITTDWLTTHLVGGEKRTLVDQITLDREDTERSSSTSTCRRRWRVAVRGRVSQLHYACRCHELVNVTWEVNFPGLIGAVIFLGPSTSIESVLNRPRVVDNTQATQSLLVTLIVAPEAILRAIGENMKFEIVI